ncbi:MAG TPA: DEAD/DEAH box helicase family protein [Ktedonobacteraceae bacterium]|nr:DEAD/DEAH box helicase family protein [Ktedonobacteraceae bacterium]
MSITTLDLRGRDLIIIPPKDMLHLPTEELQQALFGDYLPTAIRISMGRDKRQHFLRTLPMNFSALKSALRKQQTPFTVAFEERPVLPFATSLTMEPRPYQEEALTRWLAEGSAGVVVLPTGAGKTLVAAMAIHETGLWTLVVVPTLDLLQQWRNALTAALGLAEADESAAGAIHRPLKAEDGIPEEDGLTLTEKIGVFGGGDKDIRPITIITYDSAALYPRELRRFGLLVFDVLWVIEEC